MAYNRREVEDGITIMNKDLYDNLQDGIEEAKGSTHNVSESTVYNATVETVKVTTE